MGLPRRSVPLEGVPQGGGVCGVRVSVLEAGDSFRVAREQGGDSLSCPKASRLGPAPTRTGRGAPLVPREEDPTCQLLRVWGGGVRALNPGDREGRSEDPRRWLAISVLMSRAGGFVSYL